jgi:hypothetical protein
LKIIKQANHAMSIAYQLSVSSDGYTLRKERDGVTLYCKPTNKPVAHTIFKAECMIEGVTPKKAFDYMHDCNNDFEWNDNLQSHCLLQRIPYNDDDNETNVAVNTSKIPIEICHSVTKTIGGVISSRDFVTISTNICYDDGSYHIASISTDLVSYTDKSISAVRGWNGPSGFFLQTVKENDNSTKLIVVLDTLLNGWLSQSLCDSLADDVIITLLLKIKSAMIKYYKDERNKENQNQNRNEE